MLVANVNWEELIANDSTTLLSDTFLREMLTGATVPFGLTAAEVTFPLVFAKVKVVDVGTLATVNVPLKTVSTPVITTWVPTVKPCAVLVVSVATFEVSALLVTDKPAPAKTSSLKVKTRFDDIENPVLLSAGELEVRVGAIESVVVVNERAFAVIPAKAFPERSLKVVFPTSR